MPTYDYKCTNCGHTFEMFQKMSDEPIKICPKCKGILKRLIGAGAGPIFKGKGFYQTDYKNPPKAKDKKEESKPVKKESSEGSKESSEKPKNKPEEKKD